MGQRHYECLLCPYGSSRRFMVARHLNTVHTANQRQVLCPHCGNRYKNRAVLMAHYRKKQCPPSHTRKYRDKNPLAL